MTWAVDPSSDTPPSRQIVDAILDAVARGELSTEDQLPSVRAMAGRALVNHNTVARAYRDLEGMGVVEGRNGRGVFVTSNGPSIAKASRRGSTLEAFTRALEQALRSGHTLADLEGVLEHIGQKWKKSA